MTIKELIKEIADYNEEELEQEIVYFINGEIGGSVKLRDGRTSVSVIIKDN